MASAVTPLTLADAVKFAMEHSPKVAQAQVLAGVSRLQEENARVGLFPSLDLTTTHGVEKSEPGPAVERPGAPVVSQLSLSLTQPLYDNGETWTKQDVAALDRQRVELTAKRTRDDVALEVARAYYRLSLNEILLAIKRQQLDLLDKQFRLTQSQYRQGLKTKKDFLRLKSEAQRATIAVEDADARRLEAEIALRQAVGATETGTPLTFATLTTDDAARATPRFPARAPDMSASYPRRLSVIESAVAAKNVELIRKKNAPEVTLGSGVTYANGGYLNSDAAPHQTDSLSWNVLLGVKYNLWDGGTRRRDIEVAESQRLARDLQLKSELTALDASVAALMTSLASLKASHGLNKELMELEGESFRHLEDEYRQGRVAYLDLITALSDFLSARISFYSSYVSIQESLAQYRYHEGTLYEALTAP